VPLLGIPLFLLGQLLVGLPLFFVGIPLILWQRNNATIRESEFYPGRMIAAFKAPWMWVFGNEENGIDGIVPISDQEWWITQTARLTPQERIFHWSALRNSVNNLRFCRPFAFKIVPAKVRSIGTANSENATGWFVAWSGPYFALYYARGSVRISIGWRIQPCDSVVIYPGDTRAGWAGMTFNLRL